MHRILGIITYQQYTTRMLKIRVVKDKITVRSVTVICNAKVLTLGYILAVLRNKLDIRKEDIVCPEHILQQLWER